MSQHSEIYRRSDVTEYFNAIAQFPRLTAEQEQELAQEIEAGLYAERLLLGIQSGGSEQDDSRECEGTEAELETISAMGQSALKTLVDSNYRLVIKWAVQASKKTQHMDIMDLIQEGNIGVMIAAMKFDYTKGFKFSTYATDWIKQSIQRARHQKERMIQLPLRTEAAIDNGPDFAAYGKDIAPDAQQVLKVLSLDMPYDNEETLGETIAASIASPEHDEEEGIHRIVEEAGLSLLERDALLRVGGVTTHTRKMNDADRARMIALLAERYGVGVRTVTAARTTAAKKLQQDPVIRNVASSYGYGTTDSRNNSDSS